MGRVTEREREHFAAFGRWKAEATREARRLAALEDPGKKIQDCVEFTDALIRMFGGAWDKPQEEPNLRQKWLEIQRRRRAREIGS